MFLVRYKSDDVSILACFMQLPYANAVRLKSSRISVNLFFQKKTFNNEFAHKLKSGSLAPTQGKGQIILKLDSPFGTGSTSHYNHLLSRYEFQKQVEIVQDSGNYKINQLMLSPA